MITKDYKCGFNYANPDNYKLLREKSYYNRNHPTDAERLVWQQLKSEMAGIRFRFQFIIGDYIVDFVALKPKLIIEIDGEYHLDDKQKEKDVERENWLKAQGFKVIRFTNEQVFNDIESVIRAIKVELY